MDCLSYELLQWFVDELLSLKCRADSEILLMKARELRDRLKASGVPDADLPKVDKHFLYRWRQRFGISVRRITTRFKLPFKTAQERVGVMLGNLFRLRKLWQLCHGDAPMRFLSADQKPSWFNNSGLKSTYARRGARIVTTKTAHDDTRDRYTILTFVHNYPVPAGERNKVAVLFRATKDAPKLRAKLSAPPFMLLQFQEKGSYRVENVIEALDWALPAATCPEESTIVMLDWFAAHLHEDVAELIRSKGHILLMHGGGVTGFEQVNDTHLHALVQRKMEELETIEFYNQRRDDPSKIAKLTRQNVIDLVGEMWLSMNHEKIAADGYRQTGPLLPDNGGADELYYSLRPFWDQLEGDQLRKDAYDHVQGLWDAGTLTSWNDAELVIEQHSAHDPIDEGLEGVEWDIGGDGDEDDDDDSGDSDGGDLGGGKIGESGDPGNDEDADEGAHGGEEPPHKKSRGGDIEWGGICEEEEYMSALQLVADVAKRTQDDRLLRVVTDRFSQSSAKRKAMSTPVAQDLRDAAKLQMDDERRKREEQLELRRRAALDDLAAKVALEEKKEKAAQARRDALESARKLRQEVSDRKDAEAAQRTEARWLQTVYPTDLARRLLKWKERLTAEQTAKVKAAVAHAWKTGRCERDTKMPELWTPIHSLTNIIAQERGAGKAKIPVRCCKEFEWILFRGAWKQGSPHDAMWMMRKLISNVCPTADELFKTRYNLQVLLSATDGVLEQTFVYAMILLSKWLGREMFPLGVHDWPPPHHAVPGLAPHSGPKQPVPSTIASVAAPSSSASTVVASSSSSAVAAPSSSSSTSASASSLKKK